MLKADLDNVINILRSTVPKSMLLKKELTLFISGSSKRIRSELTLLYYKALGFEITNDAYKLLAIGELVHNASLLHDDVIDEADSRRGMPSFNKIYNSKVSILAGDYILEIATELLLKLNNKQITELFLKCLKNMCEAEISQYFLRGKVPSKTNYIKICEEKTGRLFSVILESIAILLNYNRENAKDFGLTYGLAFQIKNDLEKISAKRDKANNIFTAIDVMGIEKTNCLLDNCKEKLLNKIENIPQNKYKMRLEDLIKGL